MKHTKGPWKITVHANNETWENTYGISHQDFLIAETYINKANATLIAAAPELLAGLISTILYIETYGGEVTENFAGKDNVNLQFYKDLIKKAKGGE